MKLKTLFFSIILLTTLYACKQKKNQIHKETKLSDQIIMPQYQQSIIKRKNIDPRVLTFDSTGIDNDGVPFRLIHNVLQSQRMPKYLKIGEYKLTKQHIEYRSVVSDRLLRCSYPGILGFHHEHSPDFIYKIQYYDKNGKTLLNEVDLEALNPYQPTEYPNIQYGAFDFEAMENYNGQPLDGDFKKECDQLYRLSEARYHKSSPYTLIEYKIFGTKKGMVKGFENTVVVLDGTGSEVSRFKIPCTISGSVITTDEKHLFIQLACYKGLHPNKDTLANNLIIYDLKSGLKLDSSPFFSSDSIVLGGIQEYFKDNIISLGFHNEDYTIKEHFFYDLSNGSVLQYIDSKKYKNICKQPCFHIKLIPAKRIKRIKL